MPDIVPSYAQCRNCLFYANPNDLCELDNPHTTEEACKEWKPSNLWIANEELLDPICRAFAFQERGAL